MHVTILETLFLYRYVSEDEFQFIKDNGIIYSTNRVGTYFTSMFTNDANDAIKYLSLSNAPSYRVGGFPINYPWVTSQLKQLGTVAPNNGQPGGAKEYVLGGPIPILEAPYLYAYEFKSGKIVRII